MSRLLFLVVAGLLGATAGFSQKPDGGRLQPVTLVFANGATGLDAANRGRLDDLMLRTAAAAEIQYLLEVSGEHAGTARGRNALRIQSVLDYMAAAVNPGRVYIRYNQSIPAGHLLCRPRAIDPQ